MSSEAERVQSVEKSKPTDMASKYSKIMAETGWVPGKGFVSPPQGSSNSTSFNDRSNSNDRIQDAREGRFETSATAGVGGGQAAIKQAQSSDSSNTGGQSSGNFSDQGQRDANLISNIARAKDRAGGLRAAVQVNFNLDREDRELRLAQDRLIDQTEQRLGISLNRSDIENMSVEDINAAIRALAQRSRADLTPAADQFFDWVAPSPDYFEPIGVDLPRQ